ncbi:MAG: hypothetical protein ACM3RP_04240 [Chitinophagales bacterium]
MRKGVAGVLAGVALGAAFLGGYLISTRGEAGWLASAGAAVSAPKVTPADRLSSGERRPSVVVLPAVLPEHPAWAQLTDLTADVAREQRLVALERAPVASTARRAGGSGAASQQASAQIEAARQGGQAATRAALEDAYARRLQTEAARIKAEAERKVAERRAILKAQVDDAVGVKRGELKNSLSAKVEEIRRGREAELLSLQLRLGLAAKSGTTADQEGLQEEIRQAQAEIDQEIASAQGAAERQLAEFSAEASAKAQRDLDAYAAQVNAEAERQAAASGEALRAELARKLGALEEVSGDASSGGAAGDGPGGSPAAAAATVSPLLAQRDALQASIIADIRRLAADLAAERGLAAPRFVTNAGDGPTGAVDLTQAVAGALREAAGDTVASVR